MKPYFVLHQHNKEIRENQPIGSQVAIVSARDGDKGINAEINYAIVAGKDWLDFQRQVKTEESRRIWKYLKESTIILYTYEYGKQLESTGGISF